MTLFNSTFTGEGPDLPLDIVRKKAWPVGDFKSSAGNNIDASDIALGMYSFFNPTTIYVGLLRPGVRHDIEPAG